MRKRRTYTAEFKAEAVKLVLEQDLSIAQVARDLDLTESVLGRWVRRVRLSDEGVQRPLSITEREELERLRKEVLVLRKERSILKKAAAFFAQETL